MDSLKYSLKTHQFGKKRQQIFTKEPELESMSLEVHDPKASINHLIDTSKLEETSRIIQTNIENDDSIIPKEQSQTTEKTFKKTQQPFVPSKISNHSIKNTVKVPLPINNNTVAFQKEKNEDVGLQLNILKNVLYSNEERIQSMANSINSLYSSTIELYNKHESNMRDVVNSRCHQILLIFKKAVISLKQGEETINDIDNRVSILLNTLKDSQETLRIVKIKQDCIEALQKSKEQIKKEVNRQSYTPNNHSNSYLIPRERTKSNSNYLGENYEIPKAQELSMANERNSFSKLSSSKDIEISYIGETESVDSFFSNSPVKYAVACEDNQKSPFEANELLLISSTVPTVSVSENLFQIKDSEYSFRKKSCLEEEGKKQGHFNIDLNSNKYQNSFKKPKKDQSYDAIKREVVESLGVWQTKVWLDDMNCLRRTNGSYILNKSGNPIICCPSYLESLGEEKIVIHEK